MSTLSRRVRSPIRGRHHSSRKLSIETLEPRNLLAGIVMSDEEQVVVELINRAREAPVAEASRLGIGLNDGLPAGTISSTPKPPLAPNQILINVAVAHSLDMINRNFFSHVNPDGERGGDRLTAAGYPWIAWGENIAWGTHLDAQSFHDLLFRSASHRKLILAEKYRETGVGIRRGSVLKGTEMFGNTWGDAYISGIAFTDRVVRNNFFSPGEGWGNVTVTATPAGGGPVHSSVTGPTGAYSLRVPPGTYMVKADRGDFAAPFVVSNVVIDSQNVKVDFIVSAGSIDPDRFESNNTFGTAVDLEAGDKLVEHLSIHQAGDEDYFRWQSPGNGSLTVQIDLQRRDRNLDLLLYDANRNQIASAKTSSAIETITATVAANATYYVRIVGFDGATHADYDLTIDSPSPSGAPPVAVPDRTMTEKATGVTINPLANDSDDVGLDAGSVVIVQGPEHGQIDVDATTGLITYSPDADFLGVELFTYAVNDIEGLVSNEAQVAITVLDSQNAPWQNPMDALDVTCDHVVSAADVLALVNEINANEARSFPVPSPQTGFPPMYLDPTGEGDLTARDVLRVVNFINSRIQGDAEGEPGPDGSQSPAPIPISDPRRTGSVADSQSDARSREPTVFPLPLPHLHGLPAAARKPLDAVYRLTCGPAPPSRAPDQSWPTVGGLQELEQTLDLLARDQLR